MAEPIQTKRCYKCKQNKLVSEFQKNITTKDGYQYYCKMCKSKIDKEREQTEKGKESRRRQVAKYAKTEKGKAYRKRFNERHPNQIKAKTAVNHAITAGKIPRPDTLQCHYGEHPAQQYHHHKGYAPEYWLDVLPACIKCHKKLRIISA